MARLKVMTLHLHGYSGDWPTRRDRLLLFLQNEEVDVLLLQEVQERPWRLSQAEELAYLSGYGMLYSPAHRYVFWPIVANGLAILSRYPMSNQFVRSIAPATGLFPGPDGERRVSQRVELAMEGFSVVVYNTNFPTAAPVQPTAAQRLWEQVAQEEALLVVVGGNFNVPPQHDAIAFLQGKIAVANKRGGLADAWTTAGIGPAETFPSAAPSARLDYIFYQAEPAVVVQEARVIGRRPVEMADHAAVIATFSISHATEHELPFDAQPVATLEPI